MKLGCMQTLRVIKKVDFGVYLSDMDQPKAEERRGQSALLAE